MIPIHELMNRIRWDPDFGSGRFVIGYYDRVEDKVIRVALAQVSMSAEDHFAFEVTDRDGLSHSVPYHRVREVYRNETLIWQRAPAARPA